MVLLLILEIYNGFLLFTHLSSQVHMFTVPFCIIKCCSNVVLLYMDEMVGSSGDELSAIIYWHTLVLALPVTITQTLRILVTEESFSKKLRYHGQLKLKDNVVKVLIACETK